MKSAVKKFQSKKYQLRTDRKTKAPRVVISARPRKGFIPMLGSNGTRLFVRENAPLRELVAAGLCKPRLIEIKRPAFTNAARMRRQHPETFERPTKKECASLVTGMLAKVAIQTPAMTRGERFWVQVTEVARTGLARFYVGRVDNQLIFTAAHGLSYNDLVEFKPDHIYNIDTPPVSPA